MGKKIVLPVTVVREKKIKPVYLKSLKEGFEKASYGIYEPVSGKRKKAVDVKNIDLVIVPGLAFDKKHNRLGRGKGYYDRFLRCLPKATPKIGLGFRWQIFDQIPAASRDFSLTKIITN